MTQAATWPGLEREIAISIVLCASCHHKLHHPPRNCSIEGCERNHYGKGMCSKHYQQEWKRNRK